MSTNQGPPDSSSTRARQARRLPRFLFPATMLLAWAAMLVLVLQVLSAPTGSPPPRSELTSFPKRLTLPAPGAYLADPAQRVVRADQLVLDPNVPAPNFVALVPPNEDLATALSNEKDLGPLVFTFTVVPPGQQVDYGLYIGGDLADIASFTAQNSPYALNVQEDDIYGRGPITTTVAPVGQYSTIKGAIHYFANGADQFYQGLLFYWQVSAP